ncbi:MAG TPA: hypothetical protein VJR48_05450, partial [Ktedonobacterales bacterium]|nr:hypothetical protein [Ktedonobacterales bacterium]
LEMWHQARIRVEQDELFGPIYVLRAARKPAVARAAEDSPTDDELPEEPSPAAPPKPRRARRSPTTSGKSPKK